jgi:regulator of nucleoside diphosphate kinase
MTSQLVYPKDLDGTLNTISILTPIGSALLGLSIGAQIEWPIDVTKNMRVRIDAVDYQPERSGDFHL